MNLSYSIPIGRLVAANGVIGEVIALKRRTLVTYLKLPTTYTLTSDNAPLSGHNSEITQVTTKLQTIANRRRKSGNEKI